MATNLLVVTPNPAVADAIRRGLQDTGPYIVHAVNNKPAAVVWADEHRCDLAVLDMALGNEWVIDIGQALRTIRPNIKLIILAASDAPPSLDPIRPWVLLGKPFHLRQLLHSLAQTPASQHRDPAEPPWLQDVAKAAQHLTRLTLESAAQAALITRKNDLWAYAGGLSQSAAQEVALTITRHWDGQKGSDLLRFVRLESTRAEHMLYATRLASDIVLALVFDAETPFSTIRTQANRLISTLGEPPKPIKPAEATLQLHQEELEFSEEGLENIPSISEILHDVPSPDPQATLLQPDPSASSTTPEPGAAPPDVIQPPATPPINQPHPLSRESSPAIPLRDLLMADSPRDLDETRLSASTPSQSEELNATLPSTSQRRPETPVRKPQPGELDETRPSPTTEAARRMTLEPITAGLYHLTYACLLVPRFSSHYLTGDLADKLSEWLPAICVAFGWRLEFLAVRPEYLQWVVNVQPNTSPGYLMRIMRQQTSDKIFAEFPRLKKENPSGDFWAPGYLIMGGSQPHPPQLVRDYIRQTRERQGISRPRS